MTAPQWVKDTDRRYWIGSSVKTYPMQGLLGAVLSVESPVDPYWTLRLFAPNATDSPRLFSVLTGDFETLKAVAETHWKLGLV